MSGAENITSHDEMAPPSFTSLDLLCGTTAAETFERWTFWKIQQTQIDSGLQQTLKYVRFTKIPIYEDRIADLHYQSLFHEKYHENVLKNPWTLFHGHENSDFGFHGAKLSHEISMKFFFSYFHEPSKIYKAMNMDFHGSWKHN